MASPTLLALATAEQAIAKQTLYRQIPALQGAAAAATTVALFVGLPWAYVIGLLVFGLQLTVWMLRRHAGSLHARAEEARRRALLMDALGEASERLDVTAIRAGFSKQACEQAKANDRAGYWAGDAAQGPARLSAALQESAFWSHRLYVAAARFAGQVLLAITAALVVIVLVGIAVFEGDTEIAVARVVVVGLSAIIALDILGQLLAWRAAAARAEAVDRRLEALTGASLGSLLAVVADYAVATSSAPPIPDRIYDANRDRLEQLWYEHRK